MNNNILQFSDHFQIFQNMPRKCMLCGGEHTNWELIGGGYEENWFAALLREAFPVVICELCFRTSFYKYEIAESVGIAILPDVEMRSLRTLQIEKFLVDARRKYGSQAFSIDGHLSICEVDDLVKNRLLFRSIQISSDVHTLQVMFSFTPIPSDGILVSLSRFQTSIENIFGFSLDTVMEISCASTKYKCTRTLDDFVWLRNQLNNRLQQTCESQLLPYLPQEQYIGRFDERFLEIRVLAVENFLRLVCTTTCLNSSKALLTFLRSGFVIGRAVMGIEANESISEFYHLETKANLQALNVKKWKRIEDSMNDICNIICDIQMNINTLMGDIAPGITATEIVSMPLTTHFALTTTTTSSNRLEEELGRFVSFQIHHAELQSKMWTRASDFLRA